MEPNDIVGRMRSHAKVPDQDKEIRKSQRYLDCRTANDPKSDIVLRLRAMSRLGNRTLDRNCHLNQAADEIDRLRAERDEARREVCQMISDADESSKPESIEQVANRRGWGGTP